MDNNKLYAVWSYWKKVEEDAKKNRAKLECEIYDQKKEYLEEKGQKTFQDGEFKLTIKNSLNYKLDEEKYFNICKKIPNHLRPVKMKIILNEKEYEELKIAYPEAFKIMQQCVEVKPAKPHFKIEKIKGEK